VEVDKVDRAVVEEGEDELVAMSVDVPITRPDSQPVAAEQASVAEPPPLSPDSPETEDEASVQDFLVPPSTKKANKNKYKRQAQANLPTPEPDLGSNHDRPHDTPSRAPKEASPAEEESREAKKARRKAARKLKKAALKAAEASSGAKDDDDDYEPTPSEPMTPKTSKKPKKTKTETSQLDFSTLLSTKWLSSKGMEEYAEQRE